MKAIIFEKNLVAKDTLEVKMNVINENFTFTAGQYFFVTLPGNLKHHFTIVNSPNVSGLLSFATRIRNSEFKNSLKELPINTYLEVGPIYGDFVLPENFPGNFVFIALGIGITPFISMIRFLEEEGKKANITLIYSDSNLVSMPYLKELEQYDKSMLIKFIKTITKDPNYEKEKRHIDWQFVKDYVNQPFTSTFYISGPPIAVVAVKKSLIENGIKQENIKYENFTGY